RGRRVCATVPIPVYGLLNVQLVAAGLYFRNYVVVQRARPSQIYWTPLYASFLPASPSTGRRVILILRRNKVGSILSRKTAARWHEPVSKLHPDAFMRIVSEFCKGAVKSSPNFSASNDPHFPVNERLDVTWSVDRICGLFRRTDGRRMKEHLW